MTSLHDSLDPMRGFSWVFLKRHSKGLYYDFTKLNFLHTTKSYLFCFQIIVIVLSVLALRSGSTIADEVHPRQGYRCISN